MNVIFATMLFQLIGNIILFLKENSLLAPEEHFSVAPYSSDLKQDLFFLLLHETLMSVLPRIICISTLPSFSMKDNNVIRVTMECYRVSAYCSTCCYNF